MGPLPAGIAAQVGVTTPLTLDAKGNPLAELTINPGADGDDLFVQLAHEGTHIRNARDVAQGIRESFRGIETELDAYLSTVAAVRALGWPGTITGGVVLWDSSWSKVDQQTRPAEEIIKMLLSDPVYKGDNFKVKIRRE